MFGRTILNTKVIAGSLILALALFLMLAGSLRERGPRQREVVTAAPTTPRTEPNDLALRVKISRKIDRVISLINDITR